MIKENFQNEVNAIHGHLLKLCTAFWSFFLAFPCLVLKVVLQFSTIIVFLQFIPGAVVRCYYYLKLHKCVIF